MTKAKPIETVKKKEKLYFKKASFCFDTKKYIKKKGGNFMQYRAEGLPFLRLTKEEEHIKEIIEGKDN